MTKEKVTQVTEVIRRMTTFMEEENLTDIEKAFVIGMIIRNYRPEAFIRIKSIIHDIEQN